MFLGRWKTTNKWRCSEDNDKRRNMCTNIIFPLLCWISVADWLFVFTVWWAHSHTLTKPNHPTIKDDDGGGERTPCEKVDFGIHIIISLLFCLWWCCFIYLLERPTSRFGRSTQRGGHFCHIHLFHIHSK